MSDDAQGWTLTTLREHFLRLLDERERRYSDLRTSDQTALNAAFAAQKQAVESALSAAKEAVVKAENAAEKRFQAVNEFRQSLSDQSRLLMPRIESERASGAQDEKIASLERRIDQLEGRIVGSTSTRAIVIAGVMALLAAMGLLYNLSR